MTKAEQAERIEALELELASCRSKVCSQGKQIARLKLELVGAEKTLEKARACYRELRDSKRSAEVESVVAWAKDKVARLPRIKVVRA